MNVCSVVTVSVDQEMVVTLIEGIFFPWEINASSAQNCTWEKVIVKIFCHEVISSDGRLDFENTDDMVEKVIVKVIGMSSDY